MSRQKKPAPTITGITAHMPGLGQLVPRPLSSTRVVEPLSPLELRCIELALISRISGLIDHGRAAALKDRDPITHLINENSPHNMDPHIKALRKITATIMGHEQRGIKTQTGRVYHDKPNMEEVDRRTGEIDPPSGPRITKEMCEPRPKRKYTKHGTAKPNPKAIKKFPGRRGRPPNYLRKDLAPSIPTKPKRKYVRSGKYAKTSQGVKRGRPKTTRAKNTKKAKG